tara:strand:+ start:421 stop:855 length:435 start_codon:yes stop_codon:yes gene_type:complete
MEIIDIHPKALGQFMADVLKNNPKGYIFKGETLYILQQVLNTTEMLCVGANERGFKVLSDMYTQVDTKEALKTHRREFNREKLLRAMSQEVGVGIRDTDFDILALTYITKHHQGDNRLLNSVEGGRIRNWNMSANWREWYHRNK